jgi:hypothetical protein
MALPASSAEFLAAPQKIDQHRIIPVNPRFLAAWREHFRFSGTERAASRLAITGEIRVRL